MAYVPLDLPEGLPEPVESVIRCGVEPLFQDVHWMLATEPVRKSVCEA